MSEIEIPPGPEVPGLTLIRLQKNLEEIGLYLEEHLHQFQDLRFCVDAAWAPEMPELAKAKVVLIVYTQEEWCQMTLIEPRVLDPKEVLGWFHKGKEGRHTKLRGPTKGKYVEGGVKPAAKVNITLEDLDL